MTDLSVYITVGLVIPLLLAFSVNVRDWVKKWYHDHHFHHHHPA